ncbi:MAG: hypothetical protein ACYTHJ_05415 [Planctomycetota bacterium]
MTHSAVPLSPGGYSFAMFNTDETVAYQGWIDVTKPTDNVIDILKEWRDTVGEQKQWAGFDAMINDHFASTDDKHFKAFMKKIHEIERLERRIDDQVKWEIFWAEQEQEKNANQQPAVNADVLLMPGGHNYFTTSTASTFSEVELASVRSGDPVTKLLFVADPDQTREKLTRVNELWMVLQGRRAVLAQEYKRLEGRKRYFSITDHIYDHNKKFVKNEKRLQNVGVMLERLDNRMVTLRNHRHALQFTAALFSPGEDNSAFNDEVSALNRELVVLQQQKARVDAQFDGTPEDSCVRVALERKRQKFVGAIEDVQRQLGRLNETTMALAKLRESTNVIHRENSLRVLATVVGSDVPAHLANALGRECLMSVRLQNADSMFVPPGRNPEEARETMAQTVVDEESAD